MKESTVLSLDRVQKALEPQRHTKGKDTKGHKETQRHTKAYAALARFGLLGKESRTKQKNSMKSHKKANFLLKF